MPVNNEKSKIKKTPTPTHHNRMTIFVVLSVFIGGASLYTDNWQIVSLLEKPDLSSWLKFTLTLVWLPVWIFRVYRHHFPQTISAKLRIVMLSTVLGGIWFLFIPFSGCLNICNYQSYFHYHGDLYTAECQSQPLDNNITAYVCRYTCDDDGDERTGYSLILMTYQGYKRIPFVWRIETDGPNHIIESLHR